MLFNKKVRVDKSPRRYSEPLYEYLDRSSGKVSNRIRELLENWLSHYPDNSKKEFKGRFCSSDDIQHQSAFFELCIHEMLLCLGFQIRIHPFVERRTSHPDFLIYLNENPIFYLECNLAVGPKDHVASDRRKDIVYDTLNGLNSPNFFLDVKVIRASSVAPAGSRWKKALEKKLLTLDPDQLSNILDNKGFDGLPVFTFKDRGWEIQIRPIPKSPEIREKPGLRPIGITGLGPTWPKEHVYISNAINEKSKKYGKLDRPYIIAINVVSEFCCDENISDTVTDALFGERNITLYRTLDGSIQYQSGRTPNGAWQGPKGPRNTRVSGVIIFPYLLWGNIPKSNPVLWHNPWAQIPFDKNILPITQMYLDNKTSKLEFKKGMSLAEIFSLPIDWPHFHEDEI